MSRFQTAGKVRIPAAAEISMTRQYSADKVLVRFTHLQSARVVKLFRSHTLGEIRLMGTKNRGVSFLPIADAKDSQRPTHQQESQTGTQYRIQGWRMRPAPNLGLLKLCVSS